MTSQSHIDLSSLNWQQLLLQGLLLFVMMALSAVIAARAGRSPYWALLSIVPYAVIGVIWLFAFSKWPKVDKPA